LFVINPSGDHSAGISAPSTEQIREAAQAWASSGGANVTSASQGSPADYAQLRKEVMLAGLAAAGGNAQAAARMQAFIRAVAAAHGEDAASMHIPDFADLAAARRGDRAALARLQAAGRQHNEERQAKSGQTGLEAQSFLSFHPPLKKRLKRLERMGAHLQAGIHRKMGALGVVAMAVLFLIIVPLMVIAAGLMLVVIAMMIGLNLLFLTLWLAAIHAIFVWWNGK